MKQTRRGFFALLFAPLLARWMPKPKVKFPVPELPPWVLASLANMSADMDRVIAMKYRQAVMTSLSRLYVGARENLELQPHATFVRPWPWEGKTDA